MKNKKYIILSSIVVLLIILRSYLPIIVKNYLNDYLEDKIPGYTGYIEDVDIALIRGAYSIEKFSFQKKEGKNVNPFIYIEDTDISLSWKALFRRRILMNLVITSPEINFVDSASKKNRQLGSGSTVGNWKDVYTKIIPFKLESLKIRGGEIKFFNHDLRVPIELSLSKVKVDAQNINNSKQRESDLVSNFKLSAISQHHAPISSKGKFNIVTDPLMFDLEAKVENFELVQINEFLKTYGPVDVTSGHFSCYAEVASKNNKITGYLKPIFDKVDVINGKESLNSFREFGLEIGGAILNLFFRNGKTISVASKIPLSGDLNSPKWGLWSGVKVAFDHAWGDPVVEKTIENSVDLKDLKKEKSKE